MQTKNTYGNKDILQTCMNEDFLTKCFKIRKVKIYVQKILLAFNGNDGLPNK